MQLIHLDLDHAWGDLRGLELVDATRWGPKLRYWARAADLHHFYAETLRALPPLVIYGSGDFHHLAAWLARRFDGPLTIVSFDNHPDWDIRPPPWSCGCWVNRALEWPNIQRISIWGCGNFELAFPSRLFRNRSALRSGRLQLNAWAERQSPATARRFDCMTRDDWRERFERFAASVADEQVYITVDMDCICEDQAITDWEQGLYSSDEVAWAIAQLMQRAKVVGADLCGATSSAIYERPFQRFAAKWDHPKLIRKAGVDVTAINRTALETITRPLL